MEPVRAGLRQIMSDLLRAQPAEDAVILAWPLICGKEVAARSQAVSFSDGHLTVEVADTLWRNQLQSFAARYISGYQGLLGPVVHDVKFKVKQSAAGRQQLAKPVRSASSMSNNSNKRRSQSKRMRKG